MGEGNKRAAQVLDTWESISVKITSKRADHTKMCFGGNESSNHIATRSTFVCLGSHLSPLESRASEAFQ